MGNSVINDEYYVAESIDDSFLLGWNEDDTEFMKNRPVNHNGPVKITINEIENSEPKFTDYHVMPEPVVSERLCAILTSLNIYGIQLLPVQLDCSFDPYFKPPPLWFTHIWNVIPCVNTSESEVDISKTTGRIFGINKLVLDEKNLGMFELCRRLVFLPAESRSVKIFHESIVEKIMLENLKGIKFFPAAGWNSDVAFNT